MTKTYDDSFHPPDWWFLALDRVQAPIDQGGQGWSDPHVIKLARLVDGRGKWGPDRLSKIRKGRGGTIQLIVAISHAVNIPPPVVIPGDAAEAAALKTWIDGRRLESGKKDARRSSVLQALETVVESSQDQTVTIESDDERSSRGRGRRRASRGG